MLFNREVIEQGRQVIKKWDGICYEGKIDMGREDCAYCLKYLSDICRGCPIDFFSTETHCNNTPYWDFHDYNFLGYVTDEKGKELALNMLNYVKEIFIESLLLLDLRT